MAAAWIIEEILTTTGVHVAGRGFRRARRSLTLRYSHDLAALAHRASEKSRELTYVLQSCSGKSAEFAFLRVKDHLGSLMDHLTDFFEERVTLCKTAACVKMMCAPQNAAQWGHPASAGNRVPELDEPLVFTLVRNSNSRDRDDNPEHPKIFYANASSAFAILISKGNPRPFVYCPGEDLWRMFNDGRYKNPTPNFWNLYRSTMVLPIRFVPPGKLELKPYTVGFLCLDAERPRRFPRLRKRAEDVTTMSTEFNIAACVADSLYWPLRQLSDWPTLHDPEV